MRYVSQRWAAALLLGMLASLPAAAQTPDEFYPGKSIKVIVGSATGGGYDQYARVLARHISKHLPGNPSLVVQNMPNGGGRQAMNHIYSVLAKDGLGFGLTTRNVTFDPLFDPGAVDIDVSRINWLGSLNSEVSLCVAWHTAPFKTIDDLKKSEIIMGSGGPTISDSVHARLLNKVAGTKLKVVYGYKSSTDVHLAIERGEVQGRCGLTWDSINARYKHWLDEKKITLLAQFGLKKHPDLPDVPFIMDLAKSEEDKQIAKLLLGANEMGRPFFAPPGVPDDRIQALRQAFVATAKDPEFLADAEKQNMEIRLMTGKEVADLVTQIYATPKAIVDIAKKIVDPK